MLRFDVQNGQHRERCWRLLSILGLQSGTWESLPTQGELMYEWLDNLGGDFGHCSNGECGKRIWWFVSRNDKKIPISESGAVHFSDCIAAREFRKPRG